MNTDELVYIHTDKVSVTIKGKAAHPDFDGVEIHDHESKLKVTCVDDFGAELKSDNFAESFYDGNYYQTREYAIYPLFYEQQNYEIIVESEDDSDISFWHENLNVRNKVSSVGRNNSILSGVINFGNEIGNSDLVIRVNGKEYLTITIEVYPSKISYKDDYKAIVSDVTAEV